MIFQEAPNIYLINFYLMCVFTYLCGKVIVAQIHGVSGTEIRLYYDENGTIYWEASIPKDDDVAYSSEFSESKFGEGDRDLYTYEYLISSDGNQTSIPLNSKFVSIDRSLNFVLIDIR